MTLALGTLLSGRYEIIEKIGSGGMATVYRAKDIKLDRSVTVKILKEEYVGDEGFKDRFKIEARAAAKLSHPNLVSVYDVGEDNGVSYIVMEYIHGDTLKQVILDKAPFDSVVVLSIAVQMVSALAHAHKNGVVHRDIKPHNILVGVDGTIKITDFGIARAAAVSTATITSGALGSVYYLSPEQAKGGYVDEKSDIYSLGVTMYEMITGKLPYDGDSSVSVALKHINSEMPDIRQYNPSAHTILIEIIRKATQKKKDERYASAELLLDDLKQALAEISKGYKKEALKQEKENDSTNTPSIAAAVGVAKLAEKSINEANDAEVRVEIKGRKELELPETAVGFDMYGKKLKISKDDDNFETDSIRNKGGDRRPAQGRNVPPSEARRPARKDKAESDDDVYYKTKEKQVTIAAIVTALVIITIITVIGARFITGGSFGGNAKVSEMPSVVGYSVEDATKKVQKLGVTINVTGEEYNADVEEGLITAQEIEEGTSVSNGDVINVKVSSGAKTFAMPDVEYDTEEEAVAKIKNLGGSSPDVEYVFDSAVPVAIVMGQTPAAQTQVDSSTKITITVSKGPEVKTVSVPKFEGMKLGEAQKLISEKGLAIGTVTENNNVEGEKDTILSQSLSANQEVNAGTKIDFVVVGSKIGAPETPGTQTPEETAPGTTNGEAKSKSFSISLPSTYTDPNNISVKVLKISNGSTVEVVYNQAKTTADFPFDVSVSGLGQTEIQLYVDNVYQWSQNVDFSEGGN